MNKEAIALAADSAVTLSTGKGSKIFTSANKIFALSRYCPVGIMVYGKAEFMGVPWETIIKVYRDKIDGRILDSSNEYAEDFINFLKNETIFRSETEQEKYITERIYGYLQFIADQIKRKIYKEESTKREKIEEEIIYGIISEIINLEYDKWKRIEVPSSIPKNHPKTIIDKYGPIFREAQNYFFGKELNEDLSIKLTEICASVFAKPGLEHLSNSGVVIAGFGEKEIFPSFRSFFVDGIAENILKYEEHVQGKIDFGVGAHIASFAQNEMIYTFIEGIDWNYRYEIEQYLHKLVEEYPNTVIDTIKELSDDKKEIYKQEFRKLSSQMIRQSIDKLNKYRSENYINPLIDTVAILPKNELALMAESLIKLTSLKKRVTMEEETVAEPIDVALISKKDGFIWIRRKHYFQPELNQQFFLNYNRRCEREKNE